MLDTAKLRAGIHGNLAAYRGGDLTVAVDRIIDAETLMSLAADEIEELRALVAEARRLILAVGESHDVPIQFHQHGWLLTANKFLLGDFKPTAQPKPELSADESIRADREEWDT